MKAMELGLLVYGTTAVLFLAAACENQSLKEDLDGKSTDVAVAGVTDVVRKPNGTIALSLRGVKGAFQYQLWEYPSDSSKDSVRLNSAKGEALTQRLVKTISHKSGEIDYMFESFDIPFGADFCYRATVRNEPNEEPRSMGLSACLNEENRWVFGGVQEARADKSGRIVLSWNKVPADGVTYELTKKVGSAGSGDESVSVSTENVIDQDFALDEVMEDVFPRCYHVKAIHPRFSQDDLNSSEICIEKQKYLAEVRKNADAVPPTFAGISAISVEQVPATGLVSNVLQAAGLASKMKVQLSWQAASDNLSAPFRISYLVFKSASKVVDLKKPYATTKAGELSFEDTEVELGKKVFYLVRAVDQQGNVDGNVNWKDIPLDFVPPVFSGVAELKAERINNSPQVRVIWERASDDTTPPGALIYEVYRWAKGDAAEYDQPLAEYDQPLARVEGSQSVYIDKSVSGDAEYTYAVRVRDAQGNRDENTKTLDIKASGTGPQFEGLSQVTRDGNTAVLNWNLAVDDDTPQRAISYVVYRSEDEKSFNMKSALLQSEPGASSVSDPTASPDTDYYYRVQAADKNGFVDSNSVVLRLAANQAPEWPKNLQSASAGPEWKNLSNGRLVWNKQLGGAQLSWTQAKDDYSKPEKISYAIFRSESRNSFNWSKPLTRVMGSSSSDVLSYTDLEGHETGAGYFYAILATDELGKVSASSSIVELGIDQPPLATQIVSTKIEDKLAGHVSINWNAGADDRTASDKLLYRIFRFEKGQPASPTPSAQLAELDGSKTSFLDLGGLHPSKEYVWLVQAVDAARLEGNPSAPVGLADNLAPSAIGVTGAVRAGLNSVTVNWTKAADDRDSVVTYKIYAKNAPANIIAGRVSDPNIYAGLFEDANVVQSIKGDVSTVTMPGYAPGTAFVFGVRAFDSRNLGSATTNPNIATVHAISANSPPTGFGGLSSINVNPSSKGIDLLWSSTTCTDVESANGQLSFNVYRLANSNPTATAAEVIQPANLLHSSQLGATQFQDQNALSSRVNHYAVRCVDPLGAEDSNTVVRSLAADTVPPGSFVGITNSFMVPNETNRITLQWSAASDDRTPADKIVYKVYESTSADLPTLLATTPIAEITGNVLTVSRTPASLLTRYYVVRAVDAAGNQDSNEVIKNTIDTVPPVFAGLVTGFGLTNTSVQLFWASVPNSDVYQIKIFNEADGGTTPVSSVDAYGPSGSWVNNITIRNLEPATEYRFKAVAYDGAGNPSVGGNYISVTTLAGMAPAFAGLQEVTPALGVHGLTKLDLKWSPAEGATHYRIYRLMGTSDYGIEFNYDYETCSAVWASPTESGCTQVSAEGARNSFTASGLSQDATYTFIVRAVILNEAGAVIGEEKNRVMKSSKTLSEIAPTFTGAKSAAAALGDAGLNSIVVKWDLPQRNGVWDGFEVVYKDFSGHPSDPTSFQMPANLSTDASWSSLVVNDLEATEATVTNLTIRKRYCFTVRTRYVPLSSLRSQPADPAGFKCAAPDAQAPTFNGVKTEVVKGEGAQAFKQFTVSWDPALGSFSRYEISWAKNSDPASFFQPNSSGATVSNRQTTSYTITGLDPSTTYYVRVRAVFEIQAQNIFLEAGKNAVALNITEPLAPSGDGVVSVKQISDEELEVTWAPPNNSGLFNRYFVFRAEGQAADGEVLSQVSLDKAKNPPFQSAPFVTVANTSSNFTSRVFINSGVFPDTRYCFLIKAGYSGPEGFVVSANTKVECAEVVIKPPTFRGVASVAAPNSALGFTSLIAKWEKATGSFTRYEYSVTAGPNDGPVWNTINGSIDTTSVNIPGLIPNTIYYVRVRAVYVKNSVSYVSGETLVLPAQTTPKAPVHAEMPPIEFLGAPGEVKVKWEKPNSDPDIGGVFDRYLVWKFTGGSPTAIADEITELLSENRGSPNVITYNETTGSFSSNFHVSEITNINQTEISYVGTTGANKKLTENIVTCFLVRAAYRASNAENETRFVMSGNQFARCETPSASAPAFGGLAALQNIPDNVNGFSRLKATWLPAVGNFTRYEFMLNTASGGTEWTPRAASVSNRETSELVLSNTQESGNPATALAAQSTYFARMRAIYVGADGTTYSAGEANELSAKVLPDRPKGDGIASAVLTKVPGEGAQTALTMKGDATGFWDKYFIWREVHDEESTAYSAVLAKAAGNASGKAFVAAPNFTKPRTTPTATSPVLYTDTTAVVGKFNCYIARAGFNLAPNFLVSETQQTPICVRPEFQPIVFSGVSSSGSGCDSDGLGQPEICSASERWPNTGNSKIQLRLAAAPLGDFDFVDIYMGTNSDPAALLAGGVFQTFAKGDPVHDANPDDEFFLVGGNPDLVIPAGQVYFMARVRCVSCTYTDTNTRVSNVIVAQAPWLLASYSMKANSATPNLTYNGAATYGAFEDTAASGVLSSSGQANLSGEFDYLKATNPADFAPVPGRTIGISFELFADSGVQNTQGSAVFAADVGNRAPLWANLNGNNFTLHEGSLLGLPGASTVFDKRSNRCLFLGGYAGQGIDIGDWPHRDWRADARINNRFYALRFQSFDGQNLSEVRTRGASPLPRSMPVVAYDPSRGSVLLFGGFDQGNGTQTLKADTWEWNGKRWQLLTAGPEGNQIADGQLGRYGHGVMAYDPFAGKMLMVGGRYKVWDQSHAGASARTVVTPIGNMGEFNILRDVRNDFMWHFGKDASGALTWQKTAALPAGFPKGYPAQLVTVPAADLPPESAAAAGVYYFSARWEGWEHSAVSNNIWKYDGVSWTELPNSAFPGANMRPYANLYGAWDPAKKKIILTFGRGNDGTGQKIWEWDPVAQINNQNPWTVREPTSAPYTRLGGQPCFMENTRDLVTIGGVADVSTNAQTSKESVTPQDVLIFNTATNAWRKHNLQYDPSGYGPAAVHEGLRGVFQVSAGQWMAGTSWSNWSTALVNWVFKNGFWSPLSIDPLRKFRFSNDKNDVDAEQKLIARKTADGVGDVAMVWKSLHDQVTTTTAQQAITAYGQPQTVLSFERVGEDWGWSRDTVASTNFQFHPRFCESSPLPPYRNHTYSYPQFTVPWNGVNTSMGLLVSSYQQRAYWPHDFNPLTTVNCGAPEAWRYAKTPFLLVNKDTNGVVSVKEVKEPGATGWGVNEPIKFCGPPAPTVNSIFVNRSAYMQADKDGVIWLFGVRDGDWSRYYRDIQSITYDTLNACFRVANFSAPFGNTSWTDISNYNFRMDSWAYDPTRNVILVFSAQGTSSTQTNGSSNGVIWELNLNTRRWTERFLPAEFRRLGVMQGNHRTQVTSIPGKPGEFLISPRLERHTGRLMAENYIITVTDSSIVLRPSLPRFGLTLGKADGSVGAGTAGFLSVPGDPGANDVVYAGEQLYQGRRKISDDLLGQNTLFIQFGVGTYSAYLNGAKVVDNASWASSSGIYMMEFLLGARHATYYSHDNSTFSKYNGVGNTSVQIDWIRSFDKVLTQSEMNFWSTFNDNLAKAGEP